MDVIRAVVIVVIVGFACGCEAFRKCKDQGPNMHPITHEISYNLPWTDAQLPATTTVKRVNVALGSENFKVEYGPDPERPGSPAASATLTDRGYTWRQNNGFFYMWGYWGLYETDRVRTLTWGTTAVARMLPAEGTLPAREQLFVLCGEVVVIPKSMSLSPVILSEGEFVTVSVSGASGMQISLPQLYPTTDPGAGDPVMQDVYEFLTAVQAGHPDPCNP